MRLIEINKQVKELERAPHKLYVVEFDLEKGEHHTFNIFPHKVLNQLEKFKDVDEKTNLNIIGIDGDKGAYDHSNVKHTHGILMDFRPLGLYFIYWAKPPVADSLKNAFNSDLFKDIMK